MPGDTTARGYGWEHQKARAEWAVRVEAGECNCTRCGGWVEPGTAWHLDHDDLRTGYLGAAHAACNTWAGSVKAAAQARGAGVPLRTSRTWGRAG